MKGNNKPILSFIDSVKLLDALSIINECNSIMGLEALKELIDERINKLKGVGK